MINILSVQQFYLLILLNFDFPILITTHLTMQKSCYDECLISSKNFLLTLHF